MGITRNATTFYGLDSTGVTDETVDMMSTLKTDITGQDFADITYDPGTYKSGFFTAYGVPDCGDYTINASGVTFTDTGGGLYLFAAKHITQLGIDQAGGQSARINTASPGAASVTLTTESAAAGHISRFSVGQYIMVCSWAIQGDFQGGYSFPPNFHWNEFVKITSIVGDTIFFADTLQYHHDHNWPELNRGSATEVEAAGPATIFALSLDWDGTTTINDATITQTGGTFINCYRRTFTANNVTCTDGVLYPSVSHTYRAINCNSPNVLVEADKNIHFVDIQGGTYRSWKCQSSSTSRMTLDGVTITTKLEGTPRNTEISNSSIATTVQIGPIAYGRGETFHCTNTTIGGVISGGQVIKGTRFQDQGIQDCIFMTNGLMTIPMCTASDILSYMMPDSFGRHVLFWSGNNGTFASFRVLSVTSDTWPAVDDQTATVGVSMTTGGKTLTVDTPLFTSGDVGKVIFLPNIIAGTGAGFSNCTISNASPGVVTQASHGKSVNDPVRFQANSGVLPSGISAGVTYYVVAANFAANTLSVSATVGGAAINTSGGSGTVQMSYSGNIYTFITGYTNSTTVTVFDACTNFDLTSVSRNIQWGTCNAYVQTSETGGMPAPALYPTTNELTITVPAARTVYFENCSGTDQAVDLSQAAARNRPLSSYTKRTYDGQTGWTTTNGPSVPMFGNIVSLKVNVLTPYTGVDTLSLTFNLRRMVGDTQTGTYSFYAGTINLKIAGERVMLPNGVTTGAQTGDSSLNLAATNWACQTMQPQTSRNITGESAATAPLFTIEMITDQGFPAEVPTAVVPLRFRLRAA